MKTYHVYMLRCADGSFYVGITSDIEKRLAEHGSGVDPNCYTYERRPVALVYASDSYDVLDAIAWEKQLKGWSRAKKRALVAGNWKEISRLAKCRAALRQAQGDNGEVQSGNDPSTLRQAHGRLSSG